jgi:DNA invertase Pin-like site-specific DNA recombinase
VRAYLRASTFEQDASRARGALDAFAAEQGLRIAARYFENESGAKLHRPELFRLLADCGPGDVLLVEQVDRLSRLTSPDWLKLRAEIDTRHVRIVALDLPTSWSLAAPTDEFTVRMFAAVNNMMLDVLAAVARKDYEDRRRRQFEGTARAKAAGLYKGRPETSLAIRSSPPCFEMGAHGAKSWMLPDAAGRYLPRSPVTTDRFSPSPRLRRRAKKFPFSPANSAISGKRFPEQILGKRG